MEAVATKKEVSGGKVLTFVLCEEEYGIEILKVREILGLQAITTVPQTPEYMKGVLEGKGYTGNRLEIKILYSGRRAH